MKKLFFVLMLCPLLMLMASCTGSTGNSKYKALDAEIELANQQMPMQMTHAITLTGMLRDGFVVSYVYEVNEEVLTLDNFIADETAFKANMVNEIVNNTEVVRFFTLIADAGCDLQYVYNGSHSGKTTIISFTNAELKEMCKVSE